MPIDELPPETRLGRYVITGLLGRGGMGVVYEGRDTRLHRQVAIKLLAGPVTSEEETRQRFLREARLAARLSHPNLVAVHDVGQHRGAHFIVMELVRGASAQELLRAGGALNWREATRVIADACRGLAAAHAAGLIHRDIKPGNVLRAPDGTAKLTDFGLARAVAGGEPGLTRTGHVLGTPEYMSPEQCRSEALDPRSDLYALGATYYALLVGKPPYQGETGLHTMFAHCSRPVPDPRAGNPAVPGPCAAIVLRAMAKAPAERYPDAAAMLADLTTALGQTPPPDRPDLAGAGAADTRPAVAPATGARVAPRPWAAVCLASVGLTLALVAAVVFWPRPEGAGEDGRTGARRPDEDLLPIRLRVRTKLPGHAGEVRGLAVSADGALLASASADRTARLWDLPGGVGRHVLRGHLGKVTAVALSPDGRVAVTGSEDRTLILWDAKTGARRESVSGLPGTVLGLAFSPDGTLLASATESNLELWDVGPGPKLRARVTLLKDRYMVASVAFAPKGGRLAALDGEGKVTVWDAASGRQVAVLPDQPAEPRAIAFSPDGRAVAFSSRRGVVRIWEPGTDRPPDDLATRAGNVGPVAFAPRGQTLVFAGPWDGGLKLVHLIRGAERSVRSLDPGGEIRALCFAPDGRTLASAGENRLITLWDVMPDEALAPE